MSSPCRRSLTCVARAALLCATLAACSSSESKSASSENATADSIVSAMSKLQDTLHPFAQKAPSAQPAGPPTGKIRIANLVYMGGKPGGPLDLYEVMRPDSTIKPIITGLAFGQISAYVTPRALANYPGVTSNLYMFPAGSQKVALPYGALEMSGFVQGDQVTVVLGPSSMGPSAIARFDVAEEGKRIVKQRQDAQHAIPPGKATLLVRDGDRDILTSLPERYIMIDGACPHPTDAPGKLPMNEGVFPVSPGTHKLGVVTSPQGKGLFNCNGKTPGATTTITVQAGRRYLVILYGLQSDGFRVVTAPIDPP